VKRIDHRGVLERYLNGERGDIGPAMRSLPASIDVSLATNVVVKLLERIWFVGRMCKALPAPVIRAVLARDVPGAPHLFLRLAVSGDLPDAALQKSWRRALQALLDLDTTYAWGSKQRRAKIAGLARDAAMLAAIQGTVAHAPKVPLDMLAVLVADGSAASYDALITRIEAAFTTRDARLDVLAQLRTHATKTPELDRLFLELDGALEARNDASPALALGPVMGVGVVTTLFLSVRLSSTRVNRNRVPWIQGSIEIDSRDTCWFSVWVSTVEEDAEGRSTYFSVSDRNRDELGLGTCEPAELPAWLARAAAKLEIEWEPLMLSPTNLRGKKRDVVTRWLQPR
jgi:hypothetical protein